jgi:uncharacterized peroxidase-related enzyme
MAFIKVIDPSAASGKLAELYQRVRGPGGQVDNVLQVHSLRPHTMEGHMALYKAVLHHPGNKLPPWFMEAIGVLVSILNGCRYCEQHHATGLKRLLHDRPGDFEACFEQLHRDAPGAPFTADEQAALAYARKLTLAPGEISKADIDALRARGYSDGRILEINQVASYFAYANRSVSGLGVSSDGEVLGLSPRSSSDAGDWGHN